MASPPEATVPILSYNAQAIKELEKSCELTKMLREHLAMVLKDGTNSQFLHIFEEISNTLALSRDILISTSNQNLLLAATSQVPIELGPKSKKRKTDHEKSKVDCHQRRKYNSKRTEFTPMPDHDGYQWRKYGQKNILDKKYPRCYYRCTYHQDLNCKAAKQVQQCNDDVDQPLFEVTYFDEHTCNIATPKSKSKSTTNHMHNVIDFSGKSIPESNCLSADSSMFAFGTRNNGDDAALVSCLTHVIKAKGSYSSTTETETSENSNAGTEINPLYTYSNEYSSSISTNDDDGTMEFIIPQDHEFPFFQPTTMDPEWWPGHDNTPFLSELWNSMHHF